MVTKDIPLDLSEFRRIRKPGCNFSHLELKPEHVEIVKAAMQAEDISAAAVHDWLIDKGYRIGLDTLKKHRAGRCTCLK